MVLLLLSSPLWAQQRPQFTQYMINGYLLNPALTGIEDYTDVKLGTRQQWVGLEGAPETYYLSAHTPLNKAVSSVRKKGGGTRTIGRNRFVPAYPHHGVGIMAIADKAGPLRRTNVNLSYAYHLPINRFVTVSVGAYGGILRNSFNSNEASFASGNGTDPAAFSNHTNRNFLDMGLGTWIYAPNFYLGLSGAQLLNTELSSEERTAIEGVIQKHFFATAGYKIRPTQDLTLIPSVLVKFASPSPTTVDANLRAVYADRLWLGGTYRTKDAFALMAGVNISYLMEVSYAYDYNTSNLNVANSGSHEIVLGLKLFNSAKVICPRWMN